MIHTAPFPTAAAAVDHFNAPANAALRLVSVLPPPHGGTDFTAIYDDAPASDSPEALRLALLEERVLTLWQLDAPAKRSLSFPPSILDEPLVPLAIVANKFVHLALFREMDTPARRQWVRDNLAAVGFSHVSKDEAREHYGCGAELIRIEA